MYKNAKNFTTNINDLLIEDFDTFMSRKVSLINLACAFDIESTSTYVNGEKNAFMYAFVLGVNGQCVLGRTWQDFKNYLQILQDFYNTEYNVRHLVIYVHNLGFEFQFMRKLFTWAKVFSLDTREPVKAITTDGIEFRCSYALSGYSLASVGDNLTKYKVAKMVGDLDYSLIRHSQTPLSDKELGYILNDGLVVMSYIQELIETYGCIASLPLTKTGFVRNYAREWCFYGNKRKKNNPEYYLYHELMKALTITSVQEYEQLKRAFAGGFTHANVCNVGLTLKDVTSYDFTSSYPAVMIMERFPMSRGKLVEVHSKDEFLHYIDKYCCVFDCRFENIKNTCYFENYISVSKCTTKSNFIENNGRLVSADHITLTLTDVDYNIISKMYTWSGLKVKNMRIYRRGYLPTNFVKAIIQLYKDKTTLKGVEGEEIRYIWAKQNLNACYGMTVTDICRPEILYDELDEWSSEQVDVEKAINEYNKSRKRFLFYPWGVFVTAYARRNLFTGILELKDDYIYADTDSIKFFNYKNHIDYLEKYNNLVREKLKKACDFHHIPLEDVEPITKKGDVKTIGLWDADGKYEMFKTLGAKRYMYVENGKISLTVSGVNKYTAIPYLKLKYNNDFNQIFNHFTDDLEIPATYENNGETLSACGKNIHTYIDFNQDALLTDYLGNITECHELSSVHIEPTSYCLSLATAFLDYILEIHERSEL